MAKRGVAGIVSGMVHRKVAPLQRVAPSQHQLLLCVMLACLVLPLCTIVMEITIGLAIS